MSNDKPDADFANFFSGSLPDVLYHYTSMEALLSIVQSGKIWATDTRYLNDRTDGTYLFELLKTHIARRANKATNQDRKDSERLLWLLEIMPRYAVFVTSFSEVGDSLSQWRAYSPGGIGFSIGFNAKAIAQGRVDLSGDEPLPALVRLARVRYLSEDADSNLDEILNFAEILGGWVAKSDPPKDLIPSTASTLAVFAPIFKHNAFKEECEWRLILSGLPDSMPPKKFRAGRSMLVPYHYCPARNSGGHRNPLKISVITHARSENDLN